MAEIGSTRSNLELPLLLTALALFLMLAFQSWQLVRAREALSGVREAQEVSLAEAVKFRDRINSLASDTQHLADGGNAAAKEVLETLRQQGINYKPPAAPAPAK